MQAKTMAARAIWHNAGGDDDTHKIMMPVTIMIIIRMVALMITMLFYVPSRRLSGISGSSIPGFVFQAFAATCLWQHPSEDHRCVLELKVILLLVGLLPKSSRWEMEMVSLKQTLFLAKRLTSAIFPCDALRTVTAVNLKRCLSSNAKFSNKTNWDRPD